MSRLWSRRVLTLGLAVAAVLAAGLPGATAENDGPLARERRLDTRLVIAAPGVALRDLLPRLSSVTGVTLTATRDVVEQKVVIFGPARPVRETLDDLAALLDLRWERVEKSGVLSGFRLTRSQQAAQRAAALEAAAARRVQERVDEHARALAETPEQLERRGDKDFAKVFLADPEFRPATEFYALLSNRQKQELFTRKRLLFSVAELGPQLQAPLRQVYTQRIQREEEFFNSPEGQEALRKAGGAAQAQRRRAEDLEQNAFRLHALRTGGFISVGMNLGSAPTAVSVTVDENGQHSFSTNGWPVTLVDTSSLWILPAHGNPYGAAEENAETVRSFGRAAADQKGAREWVDRLKSLAEHAGKPVVADYYRGALVNQPPTAMPGDAPQDADTQSLDRFCAGAQYLWWTRGVSLLLRKRDWYAQAEYEVPDYWTTRIAGRLMSGKPFEAESLVLVPELAPAQIDGLAALGHGSLITDNADSEAFCELIRMVAGPLLGRKTPIPVSERPGDTQPLTLWREFHNPIYLAKVARLGRTLGWLLTPDEVHAFQVRITTGSPKITGDFRYLPVRYQCETGTGRRMSATVNLPLSVPHDRRGELSIEVAP